MKAKIKATGEITEFITGKNLQGETILLKVGSTSIFSLDEVEPITDIDWQHYRIQAAIAAMQGMLANPQTFEQIDHDKGYKEVCDGDKTKIVARASVMYADALVAEIKHSEDVYSECRRLDAINTASVCENMTKIQKELQKEGGEQ